jgi:mono/diheme cytochrome c family protein
MRSIRILVVLVVLLAAAGALFAYSGIYNVAASQPEPAWRAHLFELIKDRSIDHRVAAAPVTPPPLTDPRLVRTGLVHFSEMCVVCHGAPGVPKSEIGMGLNPDAPDLSREGEEQPPERLFWVLKNGIKMTGMPAFGLTHSDAEIWAMVAFLKQLPKLDAARYDALRKEAGIAPAPAPEQPSREHPAPQPTSPQPPSPQPPKG